MGNVDTVAIFGAGNGAFIHAADLALKGLTVNLCEVPELAENLSEVKKTKKITLTTKADPGFTGGTARLNFVGSDPQQALRNAQIAFVVVPAFAQKRFAEFMAESLREDQLVVLEPGNFGGSLEFTRTLLDRGKTRLPIIMEFQCMIYSGWKDSPTSVWAGGFKKGLKVAGFPAKKTAKGVSILQDLYPDLIPAVNVFETGLSNPNVPLHGPMLMSNAGWCEHTGGDFKLYWQGCTESVGNLAQAVDDERMAVGKAFGMELESSRDMLIRWYGHQGAKGKTLQEVLSTNPVYQDEKCPPSLQHRYFLEDIPYGMVPLCDLGSIANVPTNNAKAIITIVSSMLGQDLRTKARGLHELGLSGLDTQGILKVLSEGFEVY